MPGTARAATMHRSTIESLAKAAAILQTFTPLTTTLSVRQLAERTGIPRSTTHALCATGAGSGEA